MAAKKTSSKTRSAKSARKASAKKSAAPARKASAASAPAASGGETLVLKGIEGIATDVLAEAAKACRVPRSAATAQLILMRSAGWRGLDYETLMVLSGFAFSFAYHPGHLYWVGCVPPPGAEQRVAWATGFELAWQTFHSPASAWRFVKRNLDAGRPLRVPHDEEVVLGGYVNARKVEQRKLLVVGDPIEPEAAWWDWDRFAALFTVRHGLPIARHAGRQPKAPAADVLVELARTAVQWAFHPPMSDLQAYGPVEFGLRGMEAFAADLADEAKEASYFSENWRGGRAVCPQWTARKCAADYLKSAAGELDARGAARIRAAGKAYAAAHTAWGGYDKLLGPKAPDAAAAWSDSERRQQAADAIRTAITHEQSAIAELAQALAMQG